MIAKAKTWSHDNPYRALRLDRLDYLGGQHELPGTHNCPKVAREQIAVDLQREAAELKHNTTSIPF
ncbi:hypothetical protein Pla175_05530 [Pirellulimonas nuda]|uniref:Uncharacterized protein n=2 Tax=Pirellulimonas nuda TaxID=2528009 RepID=A0A518D6X0_9BACT|nr:hypothetical protein Pla175_05530 [Pirellulimonas nuda]